MKKVINKDAEYRRFHGQKAIDKFFETNPEIDECWKGELEWMAETGTENLCDDRMADGTYNKNWCYSLWFVEENDCTYIAIVERA